MAIQKNIVGFILLLMLLLIILVIFIACKPWRFFFSRVRSRPFVKSEELERPLVSDDGSVGRDLSNDLTRNYDLEGACYQNDGLLRSPRNQGLVHKQRVHAPGDSFVLDVITDAPEDISLGQTIKPPIAGEQLTGILNQQEHSSEIAPRSEYFQSFLPPAVAYRSCLSLDVVSGPSQGLHCYVESTDNSKMPVILGRVSPSILMLKDSEVSGKHAQISWNSDKMKWELVDMGSLNGTLLNSESINHPDSGSRHWGNPNELKCGDIITLGTTSSIQVHIASKSVVQIPFGVGVASDPMALRRGGKKLPMEDVSYFHWPLPGLDQLGVFGICDGHGGVGAAEFASENLPKMVSAILSDHSKREMVFSQHDASSVLRDAFFHTEAAMDYYYEGCTATLLLVWADGYGNFFAQCANLGDSHCFISIDGQRNRMTEDHRIVSPSEKLRFKEAGKPLKDNETRLGGINLGRMLGDKYLKEQDDRFSSEPYVSPAVHITRGSEAYAVLASDGFWDVISAKKAIQIAQQVKNSPDEDKSAEKIANSLLQEAKSSRTKDNTSIIFLDFDSALYS